MNRKSPTEVNLALKEFRMEWIGDNKILIFIGKRNTGKSVLVIDYLYYNQDIPFCTCISPTDDLNPTFRYHVPSRFIFDTYTPELVDSFLKRQKNMVKKMKRAQFGNGDIRYKDVDPRGLLIMDDCLADAKQWKNDPNVEWIFMNGRHAKITLILTMQYQVGIPPGLRTNIDFYFLCKETKRVEKEKLWKYYAGVFPTFDMFAQVHNQVTKDYGCMVIDNTSQSDKLEDQVFYYKATPRAPGSFKICYDEFWVNNEDYIKTDDDDGDGPGSGSRSNGGSNRSPREDDDYQRYVGGKSKIRFNVGITPSS